MKKLLFYMFLAIFTMSGMAYAGPVVHRTGVHIMPPMEIDQNVETLAATKTLVVTDKTVQKLDPDGSDRDVTLPAEASSTDLIFWIYNTANGAGEDLTIKTDAPATIVTLGPGMGMMFSCDGTTWVAIDNEGITYDAVANTHSFGSSAVTTTGALAGATLNTGQGDYELYAMNQDVESSDSPSFAGQTIQGTTGVSAILNLIADAAEDNSDSWRLVAADGGDWTLESYQSGSWVAVLTIDNAGNASMTSATTTASTAPGVSGTDSDQTDADITLKIFGNATVTTTNIEEADLTFQTIGGGGTPGTLGTFMWWDVSELMLNIIGDMAISGHRVFPITLAADDAANGDIITVTFGETVVFGEVCYPNATEDEWMKALGTNAAIKHPGMGIALESKANGESGKLLLRGTIRDDSAFAGAMGDIVFLSDGTAGDMLYAAPSDTGDIVQILGFVIADNYIYFNPDYTYVEVP